MAAKTFEQWWNENWEGLDGYDREGYAQAAWDAATELAEEKFNSALRQPTQQGSEPSEICHTSPKSASMQNAQVELNLL